MFNKKLIYDFLRFLMLLIILLFFGCKQTTEPTAKTPQISQISPDIHTTLNKNITLSVGASVTDGGQLSFKWYVAPDKLSNGNEVPNALDKDLSLITDKTGVFYYYCIITNKLGDSKRIVVSPRICLSVEASISAKNPVIINQPQNISGEIGDDFSFEVIAYSTDEGELSYQWYFSNTYQAEEPEDSEESEIEIISGATQSIYSGTISTQKLGSYYCVITNSIEDNNDGGTKIASIQTTKAILSNNTVNANSPVIITQPQDVTAIIPVSRTFSVSAYTIDDGELSYQWYKILEEENEGILITNATYPYLKITTRELGKTGYYCTITNTIPDNGDGGIKTVTVTSETAWFDAIFLKDVISAPEFTIQPTTLNIAPYNEHIQISCMAESEEGAISYRWYQSSDGTTANGTAVNHATTSTLTTPIFTEKGIYYYYCVATNILSTTDEGVKSASVISNVVSVAYTGLPTLYLNTGDTPTSAITKDEYELGDFKLIKEGSSPIEYTFSKIKDGEKKEGIKGRGNSSWTMPKKGYNIKFDSKQGFFDLPNAKKWCIIANYPDKALLRNKFASLLGNEIFDSEWAPTFYYIDVVMNDTYMGNYIFCERNTLSTGRIDVQDIADVAEKIKNGKLSKIEDVNGDGIKDLKDGGFLIEVEASETRAADNDFYFRGTKGGRLFCLKDPDEVGNDVKDRVQSVVLNAENVLYSNEYTDYENGWRKYIDEDSIIDWYIINELAKNNDAVFYSSVYMYYNPVDEKLHMGPIWDFDISFGNINYNDCDNPEGWWIKGSIWISRLFTDPLFVEKLQTRWNEKKGLLLQAITTNGTIQKEANKISISADYNFLKWQILGTYVWPNAAGYSERTTYQREVDHLLNWLSIRYEWLDSAINNL